MNVLYITFETSKFHLMSQRFLLSFCFPSVLTKLRTLVRNDLRNVYPKHQGKVTQQFQWMFCTCLNVWVSNVCYQEVSNNESTIFITRFFSELVIVLYTLVRNYPRNVDLKHQRKVAQREINPTNVLCVTFATSMMFQIMSQRFVPPYFFQS